MCGIVGLYQTTFDPVRWSAFGRLFAESTIRGLHSFGLTWNHPRKGHTTAKLISEQAVQDTLSWVAGHSLIKPLSVIGHCRYSTSGDWHIEKNNQPLVVSYYPETALAFNGNIHMGLREEYEKVFDDHYETDNDGEIFLKKLMVNEGEAIELISDRKVSFAGLILQHNRILAIRNEHRPLYFSRWAGGVLFASTQDIFSRAGIPGAQKLEPMLWFDVEEVIHV